MSAHRDRFLVDRLPPPGLRPDKDSAVRALALPPRLNAADALLAEHATSRPQAAAVIAPGVCWSYGALDRAAGRIAAVLTGEHGLVPGNRVLLRGPNSPALAAALLGVLRAGLVAVPTVPVLRAGELAPVLEALRPDLLLCEVSVSGELDALAEMVAAPRLERYGGEEGGPIDRALGGDGPEAPPVPTARDDPALVLLSSGSTGAPKAVVHSHGDVLALARSFGRHIFRAGSGDIVAGSPSLAFAYGFGLMLVCPLAAGAAVYLHPARGTAALADALAAAEPTLLVTVPTAYRKLLAMSGRPPLARLRCGFSAGEALPDAVADGWAAAKGCPIVDVLGSTEMLGPYVAAPPEAQRPGRIGRAVPGYELRCLDTEGRDLGVGEPGRLAVRGPTGGWYLDPAAQAETVREGWVVTGDICRIDADGYVIFEGRADDIVVSAGYNISVVEIEAALVAHPGVLECAVTSVPDPERGASVVALVVPSGNGCEEALMVHLRSRLAPFKLPRRIAFVEALPKTGSGKLRRAALASLAEKYIE